MTTVRFHDSPDGSGGLDVQSWNRQYLGCINKVAGVLTDQTYYQLSSMLRERLDCPQQTFKTVAEAKLFVTMRYDRMGKGPQPDELKGATVAFHGGASDSQHIEVRDLKGRTIGHIGAHRSITGAPGSDRVTTRYCMSQSLIRVLDCAEEEFETLDAVKAFVVRRHKELSSLFDAPDTARSPSGTLRVLNFA